MIQMLIPLVLKAVESELQSEVAELAGNRYARGFDGERWGVPGLFIWAIKKYRSGSRESGVNQKSQTSA